MSWAWPTAESRKLYIPSRFFWTHRPITHLLLILTSSENAKNNLPHRSHRTKSLIHVTASQKEQDQFSKSHGTPRILRYPRRDGSSSIHQSIAPPQRRQQPPHRLGAGSSPGDLFFSAGIPGHDHSSRPVQRGRRGAVRERAMALLWMPDDGGGLQSVLLPPLRSFHVPPLQLNRVKRCLERGGERG